MGDFGVRLMMGLSLGLLLLLSLEVIGWITTDVRRWAGGLSALCIFGLAVARAKGAA